MPSAPSRVMQLVRPAAGGIRRHVSLLCKGLYEQRISVDIAAPAGFTLEFVVPRLAPDQRLGGGRHWTVDIAPTTRIVADIRAAMRVARLSRDLDDFLVHAHGLRAAWVAALASRRRGGRPFVFTAHNLAPASVSPLARIALRLTIRRAGRVLCVSQAVANSVAKYGLTPDRMAIVPNGIDLGTFDLDARAFDTGFDLYAMRSLVVSVGRLAPEKGFATLVAAAPIVLERHPDAAFVLAGE